MTSCTEMLTDDSFYDEMCWSRYSWSIPNIYEGLRDDRMWGGVTTELMGGKSRRMCPGEVKVKGKRISGGNNLGCENMCKCESTMG